MSNQALMYLKAQGVPASLRLTYFYIVQLIIDGKGKASQVDVEKDYQYTAVKTLFTVKDGYWSVDWYLNEKPTRSTAFVKPSFVEVEEYLSELGQPNEASKFFNFYDSKGWMIGKNKMKDWKAACRNWATRNTENTQTNGSKLTSKIGRTEATNFVQQFKVK